MQMKMLTLIGLAMIAGGCSEKIEAQEAGDAPTMEAVKTAPVDIDPADANVSGDNLKMQSPVGVD
ncbi:MAG: hypothetical protein HEQ22_04245 [Sphingopyxis sp.]|uniref:hypothetical protein n=1 Tax=Sphingopyxis sp. TaxID=1908224 RepID=UPI003D810C89